MNMRNLINILSILFAVLMEGCCTNPQTTQMVILNREFRTTDSGDLEESVVYKETTEFEDKNRDGKTDEIRSSSGTLKRNKDYKTHKYLFDLGDRVFRR